MLALEISDWAKGKANPYKLAHRRELERDIEGRLDHLQAKLAGAFGDLALADFCGRDWLDHIDAAIERGATIVTFPPFYKGGYEALYKHLDANVEWDRPAYAVFDPKDLPHVVDKIADSGVDYVFISDQKLDGREPRTVWKAPGRADHWLYANAGRSSVIRDDTTGRPFLFRPLEVGSLTKDSVCEVVKIDGPRAMYVRSMYLKKSIAPVAGRCNFLVLIDGMLAGCLVFSPSKFFTRPDSVYLLSDVSVTQAHRVSKLISRLALNGEVLRSIAAQLLQTIGYVETTAFSDHPASMKYRGLFELLARREATPPMHGYQLQYGGALLPESPQQAYEWWWGKHADTAKAIEDRAAAGGRAAPGAQRGRGGRQLAAARH